MHDYIQDAHIIKIEPPNVPKMVPNEDEDKHDKETLVSQVGLPKKSKIGMLNNYMYHYNGNNILIERKELKMYVIKLML